MRAQEKARLKYLISEIRSWEYTLGNLAVSILQAQGEHKESLRRRQRETRLGVNRTKAEIDTILDTDKTTPTK